MTAARRTSAEYHQRARELEASSGETPVKVAVLASFTAELLRPYLVVESAELGCRIAPWFAPFGQFEQMILDHGSPLWKEEYDLIWIALRLEDLDPHLHHEHPSLGPERTAARLDALRSRVIAAAKAARASTRATLLVSNFAYSSLYAPDVFDASDPDGFGHLLAATNWQLAKDAAAVSDTHVFDYQGLVNGSGALQWADPKLWYMARAVSSAANHAALAQRLARVVSALVRPAVKCIVLDLDNTLWGGVLGDDGLEGIKLGDDYPGNVFKEFQAALLGLQQRGFLLAIATKNDEATVLEALRFHPEMVLREKHFASIFANWDSKPANLRRIAEALNIGPEAMLFVDDNPVERAQMRAELPMVQVLELPAETTSYVAALQESGLFDRPRLLLEDVRRGEMYEHGRQRSKHLESATSLEEALRNLGMVAQVGEAGPETLDRIHQLIQKTNQFNLTTRRHRLEEVKGLSRAPDAKVAWLRLQDRYGALGLVCVGILRRLDPICWEVDTFLMSCRVGGRRVEAAFMGYLAELARAAGARRLRGVFLPTAKNGPVRRLYPELGFRAVPSTKESEQLFEIELENGVLPWPELIARQEVPKRDDA